MLGALGIVAAVCLAVRLLVWWLPERMLYYPESASVEQVTGRMLRPWPSAQDFRGLIAEPAEPAAAAHATALVLHGNAGHVGDRAWYAQALVPLGLRVVLAEYPGYGPRTGEPSEESLVADAAETIALARREFGAPLLLVGESLGAGVAAAAAARQREAVDALLLITPWDRLSSVAAFHFPLLPVNALLRDRYESLDHLAAIRRPVAVVLAEHDSIVPARFGRALYEGLGAPKRLFEIVGADHNDWPFGVDNDWWREVLEFVLAAR